MLSAMSSWDFCKYARRSSRCYTDRRLLKMAVNGGRLSIYDLQGSLMYTCVGAYRRRWRALSKSCLSVFLNMLDMDMPFVRHVTEVVNLSCMREILRPDISYESDIVVLSRWCFPRRYNLSFSIRKVGSWGREWDLEVERMSNGLLIG